MFTFTQETRRPVELDDYAKQEVVDELAKKVEAIQHQVGPAEPGNLTHAHHLAALDGRLSWVEGKELNARKAARVVPELTADLLKRSVDRLEGEKDALTAEIKRVMAARDNLGQERDRLQADVESMKAHAEELAVELERANRHIGAKERVAADQLCHQAELAARHGGDVEGVYSAAQRYRAHRQWVEPGALDRSDQ